MNEITWSAKEKKVARAAFEQAIQHELKNLITETRRRAERINTADDLWSLRDFLTQQRKEIDTKYDYRYSVLIPVLAGLIKEGRLALADLEGLGEEKLARIALLVGM